jgi:membrane protease YdiL (CAAX protease family)
VSYGELLHESRPQPYPIDSVGVGLFLSVAFFATFIFTGLANIGLGTLHFQTVAALVIMLIFPVIAIVARLPGQGKELFSNAKTPFKTAEGPTVVLFGIVAVFVAEFFVIKVTPAYAIFSTDLTGQLLGFISPVKLFYTFQGIAETFFFNFGIQAYVERSTLSPVTGIVTMAITATAYHQFVYQYFSPVVLAAFLVLGVIYYYFPNLAVIAGAHGGINFVLS